MASLEDLTPEARDELALLARDLSENPATRKDFLKLTKKAKPNLAIPEIDIDEQVTAALGADRKRVESLENQIRERDARDELDKRRKKVADRVGEENVAAVEKLMLDEGIQKHDTAAEYWQYRQRVDAPTPSPFSPNIIDKDTGKTLSRFFRNPVHTAREEAASALRDIRNQRGVR
jgi:hypothetical protein